MILRTLLRILFVVFTVAFSVQIYDFVNPTPLPESEIGSSYLYLYVLTALVFSTAAVVFEWRYQRHIVRELMAVVFGLAGGLAVSFLLILILIAFTMATLSGEMLQASAPAIADPATAAMPANVPLLEVSLVGRAFWEVQKWIPLIVLACCYLGVTVVLQTKNDFRFLIPYVDFSQRGTQEGGVLLDTSAIIDGRIVEICETKLISVPIVIPDFVIRELQYLADSTDRMKRLRGRRGLDIVTKLQKLESVRVTIRETDTNISCSVDHELVRCAKEIAGRIVTTDFNLNKVSQIEGVSVINVNDIANALKPVVIPGDKLVLKVIRAGQEPNQGVGYLDDGTMIVVENGRDCIGQTISAVVTGAIQTSAGRMIFVRPDSPSGPVATAPRPSSNGASSQA